MVFAAAPLSFAIALKSVLVLTGFVLDDKDVWGRPVGIAVAADGSLLVSEDGNGTIWRVTSQRHAAR